MGFRLAGALLHCADILGAVCVNLLRATEGGCHRRSAVFYFPVNDGFCDRSQLGLAKHKVGPLSISIFSNEYGGRYNSFVRKSKYRI